MELHYSFYTSVKSRKASQVKWNKSISSLFNLKPYAGQPPLLNDPQLIGLKLKETIKYVGTLNQFTGMGLIRHSQNYSFASVNFFMAVYCKFLTIF